MSAPEQESQAASQERLAEVAPSPADRGGQGDSPSPPVVSSSSALDRVLAALWAASPASRIEMGLRSSDVLRAQRDLAQLRADLADVARLEAWLREGDAEELREVYWEDGRLIASMHDLPEYRAPSLAALGAAVATEGKDTP